WRTSGGPPEQRALAEQRRIELEIVVLAVVALDPLDLRTRAEDETDAFVQAARRDLEQRLAAGARTASRLLDDESDRIRLVQEAQPARAREILAVPRIHEDTATHQNPMRLGDERCDPAHVEVSASWTGGARLALADVALDRRFPMTRVRRVDRELRGRLRNREIGMREQELADFAIERKAVHAAAGREHEHRGRAVNRVPRAHLRAPRLQEVGLERLARAAGTAKDGEDAPDRDVDVDVG